MLRHRPPPTAAPAIPAADWPDWAQGPLYWVRQSCLVFGRDRRTPTESRPILAVTQRDGAWLVLPATTQSKAGNPDFFHIPADSPDLLLDAPRPWPDQHLYRGYESIDLAACGARKYGLLHHRLRLAVINWVRERLSAGGKP